MIGKMTAFTKLVFCTFVIFFNEFSLGCVTRVNDVTMDVDPEFVVVKSVQTEAECLEECNKAGDCLAYTFQSSHPSHICYVMKRIGSPIACDGECVTASVTQMETGSQCAPQDENQLAQIQVETSEECSIVCSTVNDCEYFVFSGTSCSLYSSRCGEYVDCANCESGELQCLTPQQCRQHMLMNDDKRSVNFGMDDETRCYDRNLNGCPDWQGEGWYRMTEPAGSFIPEVSPGYQKCNTYDSGWMDDTHPTVIGSTKPAKICFHSAINDNSCHNFVNIEVTKCWDNFFVYNLVYVRASASTPYFGRYCSTSTL